MSSTHNWFVVEQINWSDRTDKDFSDLSGSRLINSQGQIVTDREFSDPPLGPFDLGHGHDVRDYEQLFFQINGSLKKGLGDCISYHRGWFLMFSEQLMELVREYELQIDPEVTMVPVDLVNAQLERIYSATFQLLWPQKAWNITDEDWSKIEVKPHPKTGKRRLLNIWRWVLDLDAVPSYDFFGSTHSWQWICTERFKDCVEQSEVEGLRFVHSDLYTDDIQEKMRMAIGSTTEIREGTRNQILNEVAALKAERDRQ